MDLASRPLRAETVRVEGRESDPVLVGGPEVLRLNDTALAIWDLCDGETTLEEMATAVVDLAGVSEDQARSDVVGVVSELAARGVITERSDEGQV